MSRVRCRTSSRLGRRTAPGRELAPADGRFVIVWASDNVDAANKGVAARLYDSGGVAQGNQFLVNTYTASNQDYPTVAMDSTGAFTVAWSSNNQDGNSKGVYAQDFNSSGTKVGSGD